jgi:CelD/BcsL family acetyltransferase involved in cellulose biosynthesis
MKALNRLDLRSRKGAALRMIDGAVTHHFPLPERRDEVEDYFYSLRVHRSIESLETLELPWRRLTPEGASPFQTYTWNLSWYQTYAATAGAPLVFEIRSAGEAVAILPCYRAGRAIRLAGDLTCDYQDIIARNDEEVVSSLGLVMDWLGSEARRSYFRFDRISSEGALFRALHGPTGRPDDSIVFQKCSAPCPYVDLQGGLDGYLGSLPRKIRQDLRHSLNRLEKEAPVSRVVRLNDFSIRVDDLINAADFHIEHFRKEGGSPFCDERLVELFGRIAKDPDVGLQISFLADQGDLLAVDFGFVRGGRYYGYLTTYDPAFSRLAPGKCLLLKRIDGWVREDGVQTLDFLAGNEAYKKSFTGGAAYHVWSVRLMPDDLLNRTRRLGLEAHHRLRGFVKRVLGRTSFPGESFA